MLNLLLVDDDANLLDGLRRRLRGAGDVAIFTALSADEALLVLARQPMHTVVSDYDMPKTDGLTFLAELKRLHPDIIRVLMTGSTHLGHIPDGDPVVLRKPFDAAELLKAIRPAAGGPRGLPSP